MIFGQDFEFKSNIGSAGESIKAHTITNRMIEKSKTEIKTMKIKMMIAGLVAVFMLSSASSFFAQGDKKMEMKMDGDMNMSEMMKSSHHLMGMAYRQNINTLATTLVELSNGTEAVDAEFVKTIVADIKSASGMMDRIHMDHMSKMKPEMKTKMAPMMEKMKTKKEALASHIMALDAAAKAESIDMKEVGKHAAAIADMTKSEMKMKESHDGKMDMKDGKMKM